MAYSKKKNHTVPCCYLKNFSEDGKYIYQKLKRIFTSKEDLEKEFAYPAKLTQATARRNFYKLKMNDTPYLVEDKFYAEGIETFYTDIFKLLVDPNSEVMTMKQRSRLLMFFMTLHCRTPKQFEAFFKTVPKENLYELDKIKEDYKLGHIMFTAQKLIEAHEHKVIKILRITDGSEFITSDNPVLFVNPKENLVNLDYDQHFNLENTILIPLDPKHCCVLLNCTDKNGIPLSSVDFFYQKIIRKDVDVSFTQMLNQYVLQSAEESYYGGEKQLKAFFNLYKLV